MGFSSSVRPGIGASPRFTGRSFLSSSISMHFWRPVSEHAMLSFIFVSQPKN